MLGRLRGFFEDEASTEMRSAFDGALASLADAGARIVDATLPRSFDEIHRQHRRIMCYEAAGIHRAAFRETREDFLPRIAELIEEGIALSASDYAAAISHQRQAVAEIEPLFDGADVAVCPAAPGAAPDASTTGNPVFNSPWSYVGLPTVSFPIALDPVGLPLSIQLVGRRLDEGRMFGAALWCERVIQNMDVNRRP
jgi:aspartyl-tRNA(Asn)/glutamyl-tRNA(Gln) amidotransferase subunit A